VGHPKRGGHGPALLFEAFRTCEKLDFKPFDISNLCNSSRDRCVKPLTSTDDATAEKKSPSRQQEVDTLGVIRKKNPKFDTLVNEMDMLCCGTKLSSPM
jgi:hypothetical protein